MTWYLYFGIGIFIGFLMDYLKSHFWRGRKYISLWTFLYAIFFPLDSIGTTLVEPDFGFLEQIQGLPYWVIISFIWPIALVWSIVVWSTILLYKSVVLIFDFVTKWSL